MFKILSASMTTEKEGKIENVFDVLTFTIPLLTGIYLFFTPFPHTTSIKEFCFYISLLALITLLIFKKTNFSLRSPLTLPFVLFLLWVIFGLFFALDLTNSIYDMWTHFLKYLVIYYLLVNYFNSPRKLEILSWIMISSSTIFALGAVIDFYFIDGNPFSARLGTTFLEIHTDYIGIVLIFALTLTLNKLFNNKTITVKSLLLISAFIMCFTTLLTQSRGALIGLFIAMVILSCLNKKALILIIMAILTVVMIPGFKERINPKEIFQNERIQINALTMEVIKSYPITGIGFGMQIYGNKNLVDLKNFDSRLPKKYQGGVGGKYYDSPHNTALDIAVRTGIIGLILFFNIVLTAMWMLWKILRLTESKYLKSWTICLIACLMSFLIPALFLDTTFGPQAKVFYTILAMITLLWDITSSPLAAGADSTLTQDHTRESHIKRKQDT